VRYDMSREQKLDHPVKGLDAGFDFSGMFP
jgi:hypothetical protein